MSIFEKLGLKVLHQLDPETAHATALKALQLGLVKQVDPAQYKRLNINVAGLNFPNPVGLAAGFDKNAVAITPLLHSGFGFIELGAVTPKAQTGNPKPRLFRLNQDHAAINRFGFNNQGMEAIASRISNRPKSGIIGLNLGANKDSHDKSQNFGKVLEYCGKYLDFATINVSSPNTEGLRNLQGSAALKQICFDVVSRSKSLTRPIPIFLKISPDLTEMEVNEIAETALESGISAIIATNTTLDRNGLHGQYKAEKGGLSGQPLFQKSSMVLAQFYKLVGTEIPLIGVGGISSGEQAFAKILAGASLVQLYTAMVFSGISLVPKIITDLDILLEQQGVNNISEAIGKDPNYYKSLA